ncbi:MAG TPA: response regulator transcription factor [Streptosporangiaceae bacterium]
MTGVTHRDSTAGSHGAVRGDIRLAGHPAAPSILIIDDEPMICSFVVRALAADGYAVDWATTGAGGLQRVAESEPDLVILDVVMPDMDGRMVLERLLEDRPDQAVLVLSCLADVASKVEFLERGAQDYLTKPFSLAELLARIKVRLRDDARAHAETIRAGDLTLDVWRLEADCGHGAVPLTRLEFLLLRELMDHAGQSVPKEHLLASVWGLDFDPGSNVVDVCVRRLRSKLGFDLIRTVRGEGYQLAA